MYECECFSAWGYNRLTNFDELLIEDGDSTPDNEGHSAFETSGQITHIRRRYPRRHPKWSLNIFPSNKISSEEHRFLLK